MKTVFCLDPKKSQTIALKGCILVYKDNKNTEGGGRENATIVGVVNVSMRGQNFQQS